MSTQADIQTAEAVLQEAKEAYVKRYGWSLTCNMPGAYWLWQRDFENEDDERYRAWHRAGAGPMGWPSQPKPYGRITADLDLAVSMTRSSLDQEREEPVEC